MAPGGISMNWTEELTERLITEADKLENAVVLRGLQYPGQNTSGATKKAVFERIASVVIRERYAKDPKDAGKKVCSKYNSLCKTYSEKLKLLKATGGGIGAGDENADDTQPGIRQVQLKFYIDANGPTEATPLEGVNLWETITRSFKWFPEMHRMFSARPNRNPIAMTTGIGPSGPRTVLHQPPSHEGSPDWSLPDNPFDTPPPKRRAAPTAIISDDDDDSSIFVFPAPSPPPPLRPGKGVDPRERGSLVAGKSESHHIKSEKAKPAATGSEVKVEGAGIKGASNSGIPKNKKTGPRASTQTANLQNGTKSSKGTTDEPNGRKRKHRDPFMTLAEDFADHRAKVHLDNAYIAEKRLLLDTAEKYDYSKSKFERLNRRIDMRHGRFDPDLDSSDEEILPFSVSAATRKTVSHPPAVEHPVPTHHAYQATPGAGPSRPTDRMAARPSPELFIIDSSPASTPHPFGTPQPIPNLNLTFPDELDIVPDGFWLPHVPPSEFAPPDA